jgi:hypothetical protein
LRTVSVGAKAHALIGTYSIDRRDPMWRQGRVRLLPAVITAEYFVRHD